MRKLASLAAAVLLTIAFAGTAHATITTYIGADAGASAPGVNSTAARAAFDLAGGGLGPLSTITFEGLPVGGFGNLAVAPGVNVSAAAGTFIRNAPSCSADLCGANTTPAGSQFLELNSSDTIATFTFVNPIQGFGAYLGGLQGNVVGTQTITFTDNSQHIVNIPLMSGGFAFVGFTTDQGALISSIVFDVNNDIISIDDVRFVGAKQAAPEATSLLLLGVGLGLFGILRRKD